MSEKENIVKLTCKELGITQKELAEEIGYGIEAVNKASSTNIVSKPMLKAIELLMGQHRLKQELDNYTQLQKILQQMVK
ncbi:MAG: transcriptional regulator [Campylobacteraceae bacterium]